MASGQTNNFGLNQWEAGDPVLREEFNRDNIILDLALAGKGNCRLAGGSYVGTGTHGSNKPCSLTLEGQPVLVFLFSTDGWQTWLAPGMEKSCVFYANGSPDTVNVSWSGSTVTWYASAAYDQMNQEGKAYCYVALLQA